MSNENEPTGTPEGVETVSPDQIVIEIDWSDEPAPVYTNGAQILNSQREFAVVFTDFVGFAGRGGAGLRTSRRRRRSSPTSA